MPTGVVEYLPLATFGGIRRANVRSLTAGRACFLVGADAPRRAITMGDTDVRGDEGSG